MTILITFASIGAFIFALHLFGAVRVAMGLLPTVKGAVSAIGDKTLDDAAREKTVQRASLQLLFGFMSILIRSLLAFVASVLPIWVASLAGLATFAEVTEALFRWDVITGATIVIIGGYAIWGRLVPST